MKNKKITKQPSKNLSFRLAQPLLAPPLSKGRMGGVSLLPLVRGGWVGLRRIADKSDTRLATKRQ